MKKSLAALMLAVFAFAGFGCEIVEDFLVAVNIQGLVGRYDILPGSPVYNNLCSDVISADDYLDSDFSDEIQEVQIYDIRITTAGAYNGDLSGQISADDGFNTQTILAYSGSWDAFKTPQSLLQALAGNSPYISPQPGAITFLINAVRQRRALRLCANGSLSQLPVPSGLSVMAEVFGQVRVAP